MRWGVEGPLQQSPLAVGEIFLQAMAFAQFLLRDFGEGGEDDDHLVHQDLSQILEHAGQN